MASKFQQESLKIVVAQICQIIGFQGIYSSPLDVLTDLLHRYLRELATTSHRYSEHYGRTEPNIDDVELAFHEMGISISDLEEYVSYVEPISFPHKIPKLPVPKPSDLNFLKPGARENLSRPLHVHEHLPPMYPEREDEEVNLSNGLDEEASGSDVVDENPTSPSHGKRPSESDVSPCKKLRPTLEEEGEPVREIDSVMMTTSGYISSAREGKMPEPRRPSIPMGHLRGGPPSGGGSSKLIKKKATMEKIIWNKNHKAGILPGPLAKPKGKHLKLKPKIPHLPPGTGALKHARSPPGRSQAPKLKMPNLVKKEEEDGVNHFKVVGGESPLVPKDSPKKVWSGPPLGHPPLSSDESSDKRRRRERDAERRRRKERERQERKEARRSEVGGSRKDRPRIRLRGLSKEEELRRYKERENELIAALAASSAVTITSIPPTSLRVREKSPEKTPPPSPGSGLVFASPPPPPLPGQSAKSKLSVFKKHSKGGGVPGARREGERDSSPDLMIDDVTVKEEHPSPPPSPKAELSSPPPFSMDFPPPYGRAPTPTTPVLASPPLTSPALTSPPISSPPLSSPPHKKKRRDVPRTPKTPRIPKTPRVTKPKKERVKRSTPKQKASQKIVIDSFSPQWGPLPLDDQLPLERPKTPEPMTGLVIPNLASAPRMFPLPPFRHGPSLIPPPFSRFPFIPPFGVPPRPPLPDMNPISHMFMGAPPPPPLLDETGALDNLESGDRPPTPSHDVAMVPLNPPHLQKERRSPTPVDKPLLSSVPPIKRTPDPPIASQTKVEKVDKKEKKEHKKERKKKEDEKEEREKKKEEKEKEKLKKKKDKRDKEKAKEDKRKEKKEEKERLKKEKKEKKEKRSSNNGSAVIGGAPLDLDGVPKLTLKFQPENDNQGPQTPTDNKVTPKLVIKPVVKHTADENLPIRSPPEKKRRKNTPSPSPPVSICPPRGPIQEGPGSPPEIAKFSALVMRPPKSSQNKKSSDALTVPPLKIKDRSKKEVSETGAGASAKSELKESLVPPLKIKNSTPQPQTEKLLEQLKKSSASKKSEKKKRKSSPVIISSLAGVSMEPLSLPPPVVTPPAQLPPPIPIPSEMPSSKGSKRGCGGSGFPTSSSGGSSGKSTSGILAETVGPIGHFVDDQGNEVWICPTCGKQDDGSPMIGCDTCDDWYHWICVGIHVPPSERENWYCPRCLSQHKQQRGTISMEKKKRGRKKKNP